MRVDILAEPMFDAEQLWKKNVNQNDRIDSFIQLYDPPKEDKTQVEQRESRHRVSMV